MKELIKEAYVAYVKASYEANEVKREAEQAKNYYVSLVKFFNNGNNPDEQLFTEAKIELCEWLKERENKK